MISSSITNSLVLAASVALGGALKLHVTVYPLATIFLAISSKIRPRSSAFDAMKCSPPVFFATSIRKALALVR